MAQSVLEVGAFWLSFCLDTLEVGDKFCMHYGPMVHRPFVQFLDFQEPFWSIEDVATQNSAENLSACRKHGRIMSKVSGMRGSKTWPYD